MWHKLLFPDPPEIPIQWWQGSHWRWVTGVSAETILTLVSALDSRAAIWYNNNSNDITPLEKCAPIPNSTTQENEKEEEKDSVMKNPFISLVGDDLKQSSPSVSCYLSRMTLDQLRPILWLSEDFPHFQRRTSVAPDGSNGYEQIMRLFTGVSAVFRKGGILYRIPPLTLPPLPPFFPTQSPTLFDYSTLSLYEYKGLEKVLLEVENLLPTPRIATSHRPTSGLSVPGLLIFGAAIAAAYVFSIL